MGVHTADEHETCVNRVPPVTQVVAAARVRPRNRVAWRKHATAAAKALELLAVHATGDTASALASTEAMEVMVALCALPPPPPPPCAMGEFAADPDALEADQEQMMIYVEEMLVAGSALTGACVLPCAPSAYQGASQ
jgi:hypothetical protein